MIKKAAIIVALGLLPCSGWAIDQGYTHFKSSITVDALTHGTTIQATKAYILPDGTIFTSTTQFAGAQLTLGTTNGLSLSGLVLSLTTATTNRTGALNSIDWNTFNNKLSTTSAASTYLTQSSATTTYLTKSSAAATYFPYTNPTTSNVPEGSNLYFTTARSTSSISPSAPITYSNGVVGIDKSSATLLGPAPTTSSIPEGSNQYFTTARATSAISATPPITYSNGVIGADGSVLSTTTAASTYLTQSSATSTYLQQTDASNTYLTKSSATATYIQSTSSGSFLTTSSATATYDQKTDSIAASRIAAGSLGSSVIASSIAVNAVTNPSIVSMDGSKITGTASIPSASIDGSSITKQGNTFNSGSNLLQLSGGLVPNANVDGSSVTKQGNIFNGATQLVQTNSSSLVPNANIDTSSITKQGNTFNGASQLLQLSASSLVPNANIDSSSVTKYGASIPASAIAAGSLGSSVIASSITMSGVTAGSYGSATQVPGYTVGGDGRLTSASNTTISLTNSNLQAGTYSNVTVPAANVAAGSLGNSVIASSIAVNAVQNASIVGMDGSKITGTASIPNAAIDGSSVTKYGTSIPASAIASGSLGASVIASSIAVNAVQDASIVGVSASKLTGTGTLPNATVDGSSVTKQGNTFNAANKLLQLDGGGGFSLSASTITSLQNTTITNAGVRTILNSANGVQILGANDNTLANQFDVGWTTSSTLSRSAAVAVAANTATSVSTITLQAGQYLLGGSIGWRTGGTTTAMYGCMNTTANSIGVGDFENNFFNGQGCVPVEGVSIAGAKDYGIALPMSQASFNSQTTVYLTQLSDGSNNKPSGTIFAIRIH